MTKANGELKIEKGVPIPAPRSRGLAATLRKLKVHDSILTTIKSGNASSAASRVLGVGNFVVRTVEGGVRIWRIK